MFKFDSFQNNNQLLSFPVLLWVFVLKNSTLQTHRSSTCLFAVFGIFGIVLLFKLSMFFFISLPLTQAALILYHASFFLSSTFLNFFIFRSQSLLSSNFDIISCFHVNVNQFFYFFQTLKFTKRRKRDLNPSRRLPRPTPLAGAPLRPLEYFFRIHISI